MAFDNLTEGSLAENIKNEIAVPARNGQLCRMGMIRFDALVTSLLGAQNIVDIENIVAVLIVIAIIFDTLTRFGQDSSRIP